jgi:formate hydrogenlyase transcriptional activator
VSTFVPSCRKYPMYRNGFGKQSDLEPAPEIALRRYQALLDGADVLAYPRGLEELFHQLAQRLAGAVSFDVINFALHDPHSNLMRLNIWEGTDSPPLPVELAIDEAPSGWVLQNQQPLVFPNLREDPRYPRAFRILRERGMNSYCMLPLSTPQRHLGGLGFGSKQVSAYNEKDLEFLTRVAELVALAVEIFLTYQALSEEKNRLQTLVEINSGLAAQLDIQSLIPLLSAGIRRLVKHDYASLAMSDGSAERLRIYALDFPVARQIIGEEVRLPVDEVPAGLAFTEGEVKFFGRSDLVAMNSSFTRRMLAKGIQSLCCIPLLTPKGPVGTLNVGSTLQRQFDPQDLELLRQIACQMAIVLKNARAYGEIAELNEKLATEKLYLEDEIRTELNFEEIIGESSALKRVLGQARTVASCEATVLIRGETGTGKELIARAIHNMSGRKDNSFIRLNCAAIPTGLLESELFGHEKGAFTGAINQKVGRMELADKGTFFLDEVGDLPPELQPKLLRVLQDHEFERLGSNRTIRVDVRLITATNRDLSQLVAAREFRSDLYYRLNVFPIRVPTLRERRKDIPLLVRYFVQRFAHRMNRAIETIPTDSLNALMGWDWPGNVRELENFIERSVILTNGPVLKAPLAELRPTYESPARKDLTLETAEREHILRILRETGGIISGTRGAAARLGLKRTTLQSKMQKLGISRQNYQN